MRQHDVGDDVGHGRLTTPNLYFLFRKRLAGKPPRANPHTQTHSASQFSPQHLSTHVSHVSHQRLSQ